MISNCLRSILITYFLLVISVATQAADTTPIDHVVAIVNEDVILSSQLEERTMIVFRQLTQQGKSPPPLEIIRPQVLERLILENLQLQLAERSSAKISSEDLQNAIAGIARQNKISIDELKANIESDGLSFSSFQKSIENELLLQRIQQAAVGKRIDISEQDITNFLHSEEGKLKTAPVYHLAHIILGFSANVDEAEKNRLQILAKQLVMKIRSGESFQQLAQQYSTAADKHKSGDLGWRSLNELPTLYATAAAQLSQGEVAEPIQSDEGFHIVKLLKKQGSDEQWVDQTLARHILVKTSAIRNDQEAMTLLKELRDRIMAGEDFAELAKNYSEDFGSALKGGDLGWTMPGQLVPEFQHIMDNTSINAISNPFQSQYGLHILQVQERRRENMSNEVLRQSTRNYLSKRQFEIELPLWQQELRTEAYVVIKDPRLQPLTQ